MEMFMTTNKPKILFYDIETTPLLAYIWRPGKQVVRHQQLQKGKWSRNHIICVTYCWDDDKPAKAIGWGYREQDTARVVEKFDSIIQQADITIGKNSDRFDVKHINAQRMFAGLPGMPEWANYTEDLEKQMRKQFNLPSQSLDYISEQLGFGGKIGMEFKDWVNIVEQTRGDGLLAYKKMLEYGCKDVEDTRAIWNHCLQHFTPKFNMATWNDKEMVCKTCGSSQIHKNGTRIGGQTIYQQFFCNEHGGYAGRAVVKRDGTLGNIS